MKSLEQVDRSAFRWLRRSKSPDAYQMLAGDEPVALITWNKPYGSLAHAETSTGPLTLKRSGFLAPIATLRDADAQNVARLELHFSQSRIRTTRGGTYTFRRKGMLIPAWQVSDAELRSLLHLETISEHGQLSGGVVAVEEAIRGSPDLMPLLLLSWYFIVQAWFEEEMAAVTTAVIVATG